MNKAFGLFGRHYDREIIRDERTLVDFYNHPRIPEDWRPAEGDVYFAKPAKSPVVKIGKCGFGQAQKRLFALQLACPDTLELLGVIPNGGLRLEHEIQKKFAKYHFHREWFHLSKEIVDFIAANGASSRPVSPRTGTSSP